MRVATLRLELVIFECPNLGAKRRRMRTMTEKLRRHFNISIAEVDLHDHPTATVLGVAAIGNSRWEVRNVLNRVADAVGAHPRAELVRHAIYEV